MAFRGSALHDVRRVPASEFVRRDVQLEDEAQACVGWGAWDNAENIDYYPINSVFTVNSETKALVSVAPYDTPVAPLS